MIGTRVGPYDITAVLGHGGMGIVYRARDVDLERDVALKFLSDDVAADPARIGRLQREAQLLAQLNHPNIAQVHGLLAHGDRRVLVMELVEGPTLADRLAEGPIPLADALAIARQTAEALEEAHARGIAHRDLKPQNVKAPAAGRVKVLDFGLATVVPAAGAFDSTDDHSIDSTRSAAVPADDVVAGTAAYMAPESVRGAAADLRVDLWAFGVIVYEMLTGRRLFAGGSLVETLALVLHGPIDLDRLPEPTPAPLKTLLRRCLEREPARRIRDIGEVRRLLDLAASEAPPAIAAALRDAGRASTPCVAVLPFVNLGGHDEDEFFADGLTEDVTAHLAKVRSLRVIARSSVTSFKPRVQGLRQIGAILGADALLDGTVRRAGGRVRIVAQLVDRDSGEHVWAETFDRDLTDIFAIQTDVAVKIAQALRTELSPDERERMSRFPTRDLEAYQLYLQGRQFLMRFTADSIQRSVDVLERAVVLDPAFALAHATLAHAHAHRVFEGVVGSAPIPAFDRAKALVARALEIDDSLGEAHGIAALLKFTCDYDWTGAEREFQRALELSPNSADVYDHLGWMYGSLERDDEALEAVRRARELDPVSHRSDVGSMLLRAGRFSDALDEATRLVAAEPGFARAHSIAGWARLFLGDAASGIAELERACDLAPGTTMFLAQLAQALAMTGAPARAREILGRLQQLSRDQYVSPYHFAYVHTGLGEQDAAIDWLERAFMDRAGAIYGIKGSFLFKPLRTNPRFVALLAKMNLA